MKYTEIIKLLEAGYSREEIMEMNNPEQGNLEQGNPVDPSADNPSGDENIMESVNKEITGAINDMKKAFDDFKKEVQAMNIMNSQMDIPEVSQEDLIGKIINPFTEDK